VRARLADVAALVRVAEVAINVVHHWLAAPNCHPTTSRTRASRSPLRPVLIPPPRAGLSAEHQEVVTVLAVPAPAVPHGCGLIVRVARPRVVGEPDLPHLAVVHSLGSFP